MVPEFEITNRKSIFPRHPSGPGGPKSGGGSLDVSDVELAELAELAADVSELDVPELDVSALVVELEPSAVVPGSAGDVGPAPKLDAPGGPGLQAAKAADSARRAGRMPGVYPVKRKRAPLGPLASQTGGRQPPAA